MATTYGDGNHPGYLTLLELEGTDATRRVEQGWDYDDKGNVVHSWRGAASFGDPAAVDAWELSFDDPVLPTVTTVTDPLGDVSTYTIGRDPRSTKPRVDSVSGDCPSCGVAPNSTFTYGDSANPMRPTTIVDGNGNETDYVYDSNGQVTERTEAVGAAEERTTSYGYDAFFGGLVTQVTEPSVAAGEDRVTLYTRDTQGNVTDREILGYEDGQPFDYDTVTTYNAQASRLTIDPPGFSTDDVTSFTYDASRGSLLADSRTDPLVGTTTYDYDAYNRRTMVTDVNGVTTETQYDDLDRVTKVDPARRHLGRGPGHRARLHRLRRPRPHDPPRRQRHRLRLRRRRSADLDRAQARPRHPRRAHRLHARRRRQPHRRGLRALGRLGLGDRRDDELPLLDPLPARPGALPRRLDHRIRLRLQRQPRAHLGRQPPVEPARWRRRRRPTTTTRWTG